MSILNYFFEFLKILNEIVLIIKMFEIMRELKYSINSAQRILITF